MTDYLKPLPTDGKADMLLCQMLPDYKAEIRRNHSLTNKKSELDFSKLPIVAQAEQYLRERDSGQEVIKPSDAAMSAARRINSLYAMSYMDVHGQAGPWGVKHDDDVATIVQAAIDAALPNSGQSGAGNGGE